MEVKELKNIAVLIDADNSNPAAIDSALNQISLYGHISVRRAYGNWTKDNLKPWEKPIRELSIRPMQQIDYVAGKNASDMAIAIDTMELLYSRNYDGFAFVTCDSDFTPLVQKVRESGIFVIGAGSSTPATSLIKACDVYLRCEAKKKRTASKTKKDKAEEAPKLELDDLLYEACERYKNAEGYALLSSVGNYVYRVIPDFDIRKYGASSFSAYMESKPDLYELDRSNTVLLFRCK